MTFADRETVWLESILHQAHAHFLLHSYDIDLSHMTVGLYTRTPGDSQARNLGQMPPEGRRVVSLLEDTLWRSGAHEQNGRYTGLEKYQGLTVHGSAGMSCGNVLIFTSDPAAQTVARVLSYPSLYGWLAYPKTGNLTFDETCMAFEMFNVFVGVDHMPEGLALESAMALTV
jgi:hypothetical protein